jgi:selenoprotein W-related protein
LTDQILNEREIEYFISEWRLTPATGGKFEVFADGELIFSKKKLGRHAEEGEIREAIMAVLDTIRPPDFELPEDD